MYCLYRTLPKAFLAFFLFFSSCQKSHYKTVSADSSLEIKIDPALNRRIHGSLAMCLSTLSKHIDVDAALVVVIDHTNPINKLIAFAPSGLAVTESLHRASYPCGSLLKPFLYTAALLDSVIMPSTSYHNQATTIDGYAVCNTNPKAPHIISISNALVHSCNVPFVRLLSQYGIPNFQAYLSRLSFAYQPILQHPLSMACEGVNSSLLSLVALYAYYPRVLRQTSHDRSWQAVMQTVNDLAHQGPPCEYAAMHSPHKPLAYKTGLSFGGEHAWAIGFDAHYVVGIWLHDASPRDAYPMSGVRDALPLLYAVFQSVDILKI